MSCCGRRKDPKTVEIDNEIHKEAKLLQYTVKILLLGGGQTGKTTFLKQIQHLYANGFDQEKLRHFKRVIIQNIYDFTEMIITDLEKKKLCEEEVDALRPVFIKADREDIFDKEFGEALIKFWKKTSVQQYFKESDLWLQNDSCRYYFDRLSTITKSSYEPTSEDIFRCRVKTTGIYELKFQYTDSPGRKTYFVLTDVGGQRSERNKWIHCFENVIAVIFFVDLSGFNMMLDEAPTCNRMEESLKLFDAICNSQWFRNTFMILFFNKMDLFREKLQTIKFGDHVPGYYGDNTFEATTAFLKQKFLMLNKLNPNKPLYMHLTNATDTKNMKSIFKIVCDIIVRNSLKESGLM